MNAADHLSRVLTKQLASAYAIRTHYGDIALDDKARAALENALRPILEPRLMRTLSAIISARETANKIVSKAHHG